MSTNISGNMEMGGLLSIESLQDKYRNRPVKGQKLSALKDAVKLQKKSADGSVNAGEVKLLRRTEKERNIDRERLKYNAVPISAEAVELVDDRYGNSDRAFAIDGTTFSSDEIKAVKEVVSSALKSVVKTPGSMLDYIDYAKMGIAENVVRSYAEKNLSEEQTEVVMKAVSEHMDQLIDKESEASFVVEARYYGKQYTGDAWVKLKQYIKDMAADSDLPEQTKRVFAAINVEAPGMAISASNTELASSLRSVFSTLDFGNSDELETFFMQYQNWMKPAYLEVNGFSDAAAEHIAKDIALYKKQYKDLTAHVLAVSTPHVDIQI